MRFYYLDSGLFGNLGHHASYCRMITREVQSRGVDVQVFGHVAIAQELRMEVHGIPHFRVGTYDKGRFHSDSVAGWIRDFEIACHFTIEDLQRLPEMAESDIVYFNSALPCQLLSMQRWISSLKPQDRPRVYIELGVGPGLDAIHGSAPSDIRFEVRNPRLDSRATLFRYACLDFDREEHQRVTIFTFNRFVSGVYQILLQVPVETFEWPHKSLGLVRHRVGSHPICVSFLGHQRHDKGFHLLPDVMKELVDFDGIELLVHCSKSNSFSDVKSQIKALTESIRNLSFDETAADDT